MYSRHFIETEKFNETHPTGIKTRDETGHARFQTRRDESGTLGKLATLSPHRHTIGRVSRRSCETPTQAEFEETRTVK